MCGKALGYASCYALCGTDLRICYGMRTTGIARMVNVVKLARAMRKEEDKEREQEQIEVPEPPYRPTNFHPMHHRPTMSSTDVRSAAMVVSATPCPARKSADEVQRGDIPDLDIDWYKTLLSTYARTTRCPVLT
eukprot:1923228-Rhodomonas_salina.4